MSLCLLLGLLDLLIAQATGSFDRDLLLIPVLLVAGRNMQNPIGINVEGDFNLGHPAGSGLNAFKVEGPQHLVVGKERPFPLADPDCHLGLVVCCGREYLGFLHRDGGVTLNHRGRPTSLRFNREGEWCYIQQHHILDVALQDTALNTCPNGHNLIRVHSLVGLLTCKFVRHFLHPGHAGHSPYQNELINFAGTDSCFLETITHRLLGPIEKTLGQLFHLRAGKLHLDMLRTGLVSRHEGEIDFVCVG